MHTVYVVERLSPFFEMLPFQFPIKNAMAQPGSVLHSVLSIYLSLASLGRQYPNICMHPDPTGGRPVTLSLAETVIYFHSSVSSHSKTSL